MNSGYLVLEGKERTLAIVRRILTEPKTALAGVILETSFARFMASMAMFNEERVPSRPFGRWVLAAIVEKTWRREHGLMRGRGAENEPDR